MKVEDLFSTSSGDNEKHDFPEIATLTGFVGDWGIGACSCQYDWGTDSFLD